MFRVLDCITNEHDWRLVLLAALICAATSLTALHAYGYAMREQGSRRMAWVFLTAIAAAAGIWATHFVGMLAYDPDQPTNYDAALTIGSLLIAVAATTAGFAVAARGSRWTVAAGGAIIGSGVGLMHFTGMQALSVPGVLTWERGLVAAAIIVGIVCAASAMLVSHELKHRCARWIAPALLTLAICGLHFTAMGGVTIVPDPAIVVQPSSIESSTLAVAVTAITVLVMLAVLAMMLITSEGKRDALHRNQELVDASLEGLVVAQMGRIVNVNRRILELTGKSADELIGQSVTGDLLAGDCAEASSQATGMSLTTAAGTSVPVEVVRRPLTGSTRANEVYAIRDLTERRRDEAALQAQNARLDLALAKLEQQKTDLDMALANMSQGLAMFDAEERLVLANDRYAEIYGHEQRYSRPGTTLRELVEHRISLGLYPGMTVSEALQKMRERVGRRQASHLVNRLGDGRVLSVSIHPRTDGGWVVTLHDMTERERLNARLKAQNSLLQQREEELAAQNARFDAAISNMSQGMCLYDAQHRIVFANRRYSEIYGLTCEQVKPGTSLREVFEARAANSSLARLDAEQFVSEGIARFSRCTTEVLELSDGRYISVVRRPMPGGGLLSTHEDITERAKLNAQLARQNALLKQREHELNARNEQLDLAMENMSQGLAMYDSERRLIVCNSRYSQMYGLTAEQVKPGTTLRQIFDYRLQNGHYHVKDSDGFVGSWMGEFGEVSARTQELADGRTISVLRRRTASGGRVITHEDITERQCLQARLEEQNARLKEQEERLTSQNLQLDAALNNMLQGLAMYDGDYRLVICNRRYAEMYGLSPEQVKPGTPLREIIKHRIAHGEFRDENVDDLVRERMERVAGPRTAQYVNELADGRHIAVSTQPMAGGGTVTTHHDITEQRRSEAKIAHMALHDTLTGLPNRVLLNERLEGALRRVRRGDIVAMHLLDLDHFKTVNDSMGHPAGDKLLEMVADRLRSVLRETDTIARMGGDEFAIVQTAIAQPADATALAHRVIEIVSAPYVVEGHQVVIGTSVGIAVGSSDGAAPDQLIRNADLALYRAKADGRGTYRFFEHEMDAQMQVRRSLESDLRKALTAGEFELHYQPFLALASNDVSGFEALVRWRHREKGLVLPGTFIPLAEEMGLIVPLGEWAIREACATAVNWPSDIKVAVNLSPMQFRCPGLVQVVVGALASSGLAADRLELEITESTLLQDSEATLSMLYQLRALGVRIAMDDFGTGYSSLSYLQSFPFDKIKIDRSFVKDIAEGVGSLNIVRAVAAMANGLGMTTTAEGVETQQQLDMVRAEGCTEIQGFLFSKPMPPENIAQFVRDVRGRDACRQDDARAPVDAANAA